MQKAFYDFVPKSRGSETSLISKTRCRPRQFVRVETKEGILKFLNAKTSPSTSKSHESCATRRRHPNTSDYLYIDEIIHPFSLLFVLSPTDRQALLPCKYQLDKMEAHSDVPAVLTIAGSDSSGGAGIQVRFFRLFSGIWNQTTDNVFAVWWNVSRLI